MSLALPTIAFPTATPPTWPRKRMAVVLAVVLAAHWLLLVGAPKQWFANAFHAALPASAEAMQTRVLPPAETAPSQAQPEPADAPRNPPPPAPATVTPAAATAGIPPADSTPIAPSAPLDTAPTAPELIASLAPPEAPAPFAAPAPAPPVPEAIQPTVVPTTTVRPQRYAFPPPVRLNYDLDALTGGRRDTGGAKLIWTHDGTSYHASLIATKFYINLRQWTSKGALAETGLAPLRFGDKGRGSEVAAHFVRDEGKVIFSANTPAAPLLPGSQDHLSVIVQLASMWAGEAQRFSAGESLAFQSIGPRQSETWTFVVSPEETITVPGGTFNTIKLTRESTGEYSTKAELWLAPKLAYLPARIRLTETNGNVLDMAWTHSEQL